MPDIRKLPIDELQLGMFVTEIVSQKSGLKVKAGGKVSKKSLIDKMKAQQVAFVYVDFDLSEQKKQPTPTLQSSPDPKDEKSPESEAKSEGKQKPKVPQRFNAKPTSIKQELDRAEVLFQEAKQLQERLFDSAIKDEAIDLEVVEEATNEIMASIFRNPDALLFMTRLKDRDAYLFEHAINTSILMTAFATYLEYDEGLIQEMAIGAFMLDIGKTLIPKDILNKSGKLTQEEFATVRKHVEYSRRIVENIPGVSPVSLDVVATHHERLDASGYPEGLEGDDIPTWGRMIAIVDTYDAMTTNRRYQGASPSVKAFRTMLDAPQLFDNELVQKFIKCVGVYPVGSLVKLKSGKIGMVIRSRENHPLQPIIVTFYNITQRNHTEVKKVDLRRSNEEIEMNIKAEDIDLDMNRGLLENLFMQVGH